MRYLRLLRSCDGVLARGVTREIFERRCSWLAMSGINRIDCGCQGPGVVLSWAMGLLRCSCRYHSRRVAGCTLPNSALTILSAYLSPLHTPLGALRSMFLTTYCSLVFGGHKGSSELWSTRCHYAREA